jgi:2-haloacid dehalogenase
MERLERECMKYKWILFDADGTLFDYERAENRALQSTFADLSEPFRKEYFGLYRIYNAQVWAEFEQGRIGAVALRVERFRRMFAAAGIQRQPEEFSRVYLPNLAKGSYLIRGAEETVAALRPLFKLGLITNGLSDVQRPRLAASPLADVFDVVAISEELGAAKPHAAYFDAVFRLMDGADRRTVLVVGDGLTSDIQGGAGYDLDTCWYNPGAIPADSRFPATYEVKQLEDVVEIAKNGKRGSL